MEVKSRKPGELVFSVLMVLLSAGLLYQAFFISDSHALSSPGAFPMSAAAIMLVFSSITVFDTLKKTPVPSALRAFLQQIVPTNVVIMLVLIGLFAFCLESIGFVITTFVFLTVTLLLLHQRNLVKAVSIALLALVVIYIIFRLVFLVILPEGVIPEGEVLSYLSSLFSGGA
ncbi:tripartite tricarboxylate transporter TctB family protein [Vibrio sp. CDRSL-10 TSBA]